MGTGLVWGVNGGFGVTLKVSVVFVFIFRISPEINAPSAVPGRPAPGIAGFFSGAKEAFTPAWVAWGIVAASVVFTWVSADCLEPPGTADRLLTAGFGADEGIVEGLAAGIL